MPVTRTVEQDPPPDVRVLRQGPNGTLDTVFTGQLQAWLAQRDEPDEVVYVAAGDDTPRRAAIRDSGYVQWEEPELPDMPEPESDGPEDPAARRANSWGEAMTFPAVPRGGVTVTSGGWQAVSDEPVYTYNVDAPNYLDDLRRIHDSTLAAVEAEVAELEARRDHLTATVRVLQAMMLALEAQRPVQL
jgi:hypothetical protein